MNYEYQIVQAPDLLTGRQLDEIARDGWRLVAIIKKIVSGKDMFYFYLERLVRAI